MENIIDDSGDPAFLDEYGLRESYETPDGIAVHGDTMFIAGTMLDRMSGGARDLLDDLTFIPTRQAYNTQRYQQALEGLKKNKGVKYLVGHSLGGAAAAALTEQFPDLEARVYGAPLIRSSPSVRLRSFRHRYDPISFLDRGAVVNQAPGFNPHSYKGF